MLLSPPTLALLLVSWTVIGMMILAAGFGIRVLRHWDIDSGSERQLKLERSTYLISTLVSVCFVAQLLSLILFIYNAEQLSAQFVGAMCATGVLNVNPYGWPALYLKIGGFFAAAAWLSLNRTDNRGWDYPLVKVKYALLLLILPLLLAEAVVVTSHFLLLSPDVITSCCGALFTPEGGGVAAEISGIEPATAGQLLIAGAMAALLSGGWYLWRQRGGLAFACGGLLAFVTALVSIVSLIALYIYQHPNHHCPFCILNSGHNHIGYLLYIPLFTAAAMALGVGTLAPFRATPSLQYIIPLESRRMAIRSLLSLLVFYFVAGYSLISSNLSMQGVWW